MVSRVVDRAAATMFSTELINDAPAIQLINLPTALREYALSATQQENMSLSSRMFGDTGDTESIRAGCGEVKFHRVAGNMRGNPGTPYYALFRRP